MAKKKGLKLIIAGSREINDYLLCKRIIEQIIEENKLKIDEVVCGMCEGPDLIGKSWAESNNIKVKEFPADWNNINVPNALVRTNKFGKSYNAKAGFDRNSQMVEYCDIAIVIWDGQSTGSDDTVKKMKQANKEVYCYNIYGTKDAIEATIDF